MKEAQEAHHDNVLLRLINIFQDHGFKAEKIPREEGKLTPDLKVKNSQLTYFIELKTINNPGNFEELNQHLEDLEKGLKESRKGIRKEREVLITSHHGGDNKGYPGRLEKALEQVYSPIEVSNSLKIVWIHSNNYIENSGFEHARRYIYGITTVWPQIGGGDVKECYYFSSECKFFLPSSQEESKVFDGAILSCGELFVLCLNPFSPLYDELKGSKLFTIVDGWCDPLELERKGEIYIASLDADRTSQKTLAAHLKQKYSLGDLMFLEPRDYKSTSYFLKAHQGQ